MKIVNQIEPKPEVTEYHVGDVLAIGATTAVMVVSVVGDQYTLVSLSTGAQLVAIFDSLEALYSGTHAKDEYLADAELVIKGVKSDD